MSDPRSPSLDAAVEAAAFRLHRLRHGFDPSSAGVIGLSGEWAREILEAALPHLQSSPAAPSGEPSDDEVHRTMFAADTAFLEAQSRGILGAEALRLAVKAAITVDRARVDRPREPSPELREPQESVSADKVRGIFRDRETVEWDDEVRERPQEPPEGDG